MSLKPSKREAVREKIKARRVPRRPYKIVGIGLYEDQARSIDHAIQELQDAGYPKANRSLVFQMLVQRFLQETEGMTPREILDYFLRAPIKRPLSRATAREEEPTASRERTRVRPPRTASTPELPVAE